MMLNKNSAIGPTINDMGTGRRGGVELWGWAAEEGQAGGRGGEG